MKIYFAEARTNVDVLPVAKKLLPYTRNFETLGLFTTVQHLDNLDTLKQFLESRGKKVKIGKIGPHCAYSGQVLGCDDNSATSVKADAYVFLGTGRFHPIVVAANTGKPVFVIDPFSDVVSEIENHEVRRFLSKKAIAASKVKDAKTIGILATVKPGQNRLGLAIQLRKKLEKKGKTVFVFLGETLDPASMQNFSEVQAWINTCCPRMVEDTEAFGRPIVNFEDLN